MAEETTVRSVRASKEVFDRLTELTKESFGNTNSALEALLNAWDIQSAKETMGEAKTAIADFDMHVQAIQRGYLHALDLIKGADARALDTVRAQLEAKDETIIALRHKAEEAERRAQEAETHAAEWEEKATREAEKAEAAKSRAESAENTLARTEATAATQIEDKEKLIHSLTAQVAELSEQARQNATAIAKTASLREELEQTKSKLTDAQTAAIVADAKATAEKALAVSAAREEASTRLLQLTDENAALRVEIERAKAKITLLESPKELQAANAAPMSDQTPPAPAKDTSNAAKRRRAAAKEKANATPNAAKATKED